MADLVARVIFEAVDNVSTTMKTIAQGLADQANSLDKWAGLAGTMGAKMTAAFTVPAGFMLHSAMDHETALNSLRQTYHGTEAQFTALEGHIRGLAEQYGFAKDQIIEVYKAMSTLNIPVERQNSLFDITARAAMAMKLPLADVGEYASRMQAKLGLSNEATQALMEQLNLLSTRSGPNAAKALMQTSLRADSMMKAMGGEQAIVASRALNSALIAGGANAYQASNMMNKFADALSKPKLSTEQEVGLQSLGMTVQQLQYGMKTNAAQTLLEVFTRLSKLDFGSQKEFMRAFFGSGSRGAAGAQFDVINDPKKFIDAFAAATDAQGAHAKMLADYQRTMGEANTVMSQFSQTLDNIKETMAGTWLEPMKEGLKSIKGFLDGLKENHPELLQNLGKAFGVLALTGPGLVAGAAGMHVAAQAMRLMALAITPEVILPLAAALLVLKVVFDNWDKISPALGRLGDAFNNLANAFLALFGTNIGDFTKKMAPFFDVLDSQLGLGIVGFIDSLASAMNSLAKVINAPLKWDSWKGLFGAIKDFGSMFNPATAIGSAVGGAIAKQTMGGPQAAATAEAARGAAAAGPATDALTRALAAAGPSASTAAAAPAPSPELLRQSSTPERVIAELQGRATVDVNIGLDPSLRLTGMSSHDDGRNIQANVGHAMQDTAVKP